MPAAIQSLGWIRDEQRRVVELVRVLQRPRHQCDAGVPTTLGLVFSQFE